MSINKIKIVLIGCGRIGNRHAEHISKYADLIAVCDTVKSKADSLSKKYNCLAFYSIEEFIKSNIFADVVSICTPNGLHAKHSILSLNAGYNVLCEKPMATSASDCGDMIFAAEKNNKRLFTIKQNRYNPPVKELKKVVEEGKLGKILSVQLSCFWNRNNDYYEDSWKGTKDLDGGTLYTQFSHFIDLLYWIIGDIEEVKGFSKNYLHEKIIDFEDSGVIALTFKNGVIGTINYTVNSYEKNMEGSLTVFGSRGTIKIGGQYLNELEYCNIKDYKVKKLPIGNKANNYGNYTGSMSNHDKIYQNLVDVILNQGTITTSAYEGLKTVEIIEKIYNEIRKN